jgi:hypothetical protein
MQNPVGNVEVSLYAFPDKNKKIDKEPEIPVGLKELIHAGYEKPSEKERA